MSAEIEANLPEGVKSVRIPEQKEFDGILFPLILIPDEKFTSKETDFWTDWVKENLGTLEKLLLKYGAILFRDFPFETPKDFDDFTKAYGYKEFPYFGGLAIRKNIVGNVLTSTSAPPECQIPFHHEMAHVVTYPLVLFFYCDIPPKEGGNTPVLLSNVVYRKMVERDPELVRRMEREGLRYIRVAPERDELLSPVGRSWKSTFMAQDREEAERKAKAAGYDIEWFEDGSMKTITQPLPGIRIDKRTGKKMWFNSSFSSYYAVKDDRNDPTKSVIFQNGDTLTEENIATIEKILSEASVSFKWQWKDVILIDNRTVQHARSANFVPPRRILASLYTDHQGELAFLE